MTEEWRYSHETKAPRPHPGPGRRRGGGADLRPGSARPGPHRRAPPAGGPLRGHPLGERRPAAPRGRAAAARADIRQLRAVLGRRAGPLPPQPDEGALRLSDRPPRGGQHDGRADLGPVGGQAGHGQRPQPAAQSHHGPAHDAPTARGLRGHHQAARSHRGGPEPGRLRLLPPPGGRPGGAACVPGRVHVQLFLGRADRRVARPADLRRIHP